MTFDEAYKNLYLKFTSGNDIPIKNANITRDEWDAINQYLKFLAPGIAKGEVTEAFFDALSEDELQGWE